MNKKLKELHEKADREMEEKIVELQKKYNLDRKVVKDILAEGNDLCCNFYENKKGQVKEIHIKAKRNSENRLTEV